MALSMICFQLPLDDVSLTWEVLLWKQDVLGTGLSAHHYTVLCWNQFNQKPLL